MLGLTPLALRLLQRLELRRTNCESCVPNKLPRKPEQGRQPVLGRTSDRALQRTLPQYLPVIFRSRSTFRRTWRGSLLSFSHQASPKLPLSPLLVRKSQQLCPRRHKLERCSPHALPKYSNPALPSTTVLSQVQLPLSLLSSLLSKLQPIPPLLSQGGCLCARALH